MRKLKDLREKAGMTQQELATKCEVLQDVISKIENGEYHKSHKKVQYYCGKEMRRRLIDIFPQLTLKDFKVSIRNIKYLGKVS